VIFRKHRHMQNKLHRLKQQMFIDLNSSKNLKHEITQPNLQQFQQELSGRNSCLCSCCRSATSAHSITLFELHYNRNGLQTRCYSSLSLSLSLSVFPSLFLSLFLLLIDLRPQRIKSHSLKMPLSCTATRVFMPSARIIDAPVDHHPHT